MGIFVRVKVNARQLSAIRACMENSLHFISKVRQYGWYVQGAAAIAASFGGVGFAIWMMAGTSSYEKEVLKPVGCSLVFLCALYFFVTRLVALAKAQKSDVQLSEFFQHEYNKAIVVWCAILASWGFVLS